MNLRCKLRWFVANLYVAKSRRRFYFLQNKNLLREEVVIRTTNHLNLQSNIAGQVKRNMLSVLLGLKQFTSNRPASRCREGIKHIADGKRRCSFLGVHTAQQYVT